MQKKKSYFDQNSINGQKSESCYSVNNNIFSYLLKVPKESQNPLHFHNIQIRGHNATMQILPNLWFVRLANPPKNLFCYFVVVDVVFVRVGVFPFHVPNGTNITSRLKLQKISCVLEQKISESLTSVT